MGTLEADEDVSLPNGDSNNLRDTEPAVGSIRNSAPPKSRTLRFLSQIKWFMLDQWFLLALGCLILIASQVQVSASGQGAKELVISYLCVALIFIITGCTLSTQVLLQNYKRWRVHLFVQIQSFLMTSVIAFAIVSICATNPEFMDAGLLVGIIFMGCVPTTISSNVVMTGQAHGNQALTVVQSTLGNFLGPFLTPLLLLMYTSTGAWYTKILPTTGTGSLSALYGRVLKQLGLSVFLPLTVGQIIQNLFPSATQKVFTTWKLKKLGSLCLLIIIWQTFDQAFSTRAFASVHGSNMLFLVFVSIALYLLWTTICIGLSLLWLGKKDTIAVAYCVPAKTPAMGVPLANVMFVGVSALTQSKIQIPMVIFQGFQIAGGSLMTLAFRRWVRPEEEDALRALKERAQEGGVARTGSPSVV